MKEKVEDEPIAGEVASRGVIIIAHGHLPREVQKAAKPLRIPYSLEQNTYHAYVGKRRLGLAVMVNHSYSALAQRLAAAIELKGLVAKRHVAIYNLPSIGALEATHQEIKIEETGELKIYPRIPLTRA